MDIRFHLGENGRYRIVNVAFLICIGLFGLGRYLGIHSPGVWHVLIAVLTVALLACFNYLSSKGRILYIPIAAGGLCVTVAVVGFHDITAFLSSYIHWLLNKPSWQDEWLKGYETLQVLIIVFICYLVEVLLEKDFRIKLIWIFLLMIGLGYCLFAKREMPHAGVTLIICYFVTVMAEWIQRYWKKVRSRSIQAYMTWIMPFMVLYFLLLLWMPAPQKPYDWKFFKEIYQTINESFRTISHNIMGGNREDFDTGLSGFSERGTLVGDLQSEDSEIMLIQGNRGLVTNIYIIGKVYDTFDGSTWQQKNEVISRERYLDTVQTISAVQAYDKENMGDYIARTQLAIKYQYFNTSYVFAPLKTWALEQQEKNLYFQNKGGSLYFDDKKGYGTEYKASFYQLNVGQDIFYDFLENAQKPNEELVKSILSNMKARIKEELTLKDMENYRRAIYGNYMEEISLSPAVEEYLEQVTQDAETDVEKLRAIEEELSSYTYSQTPGELPDGVTDSSTFLDYFLLESRQGYCSHFATAFVLLARAEGIPARYVQGYCVPVQKNGKAIVTSEMAHAWPEVYLDNIGWIPFEPTPGYASIRYTPWDVKQSNKENVTEGGVGVGNISTAPIPEIQEMPHEEVPETEIQDENMQVNNSWLILRIVLLAVAAIVTAGVLVLILERLIVGYRYRRMNESQKYIVEIYRNFRILAGVGLKRASGETLEEFQSRINNSLNREVSFAFIDQYEEVIYGERNIDSQMIKVVKTEQDRLSEILKERSKWKYLYYRVLSIDF